MKQAKATRPRARIIRTSEGEAPRSRRGSGLPRSRSSRAGGSTRPFRPCWPRERRNTGASRQGRDSPCRSSRTLDRTDAGRLRSSGSCDRSRRLRSRSRLYSNRALVFALYPRAERLVRVCRVHGFITGRAHLRNHLKVYLQLGQPPEAEEHINGMVAHGDGSSGRLVIRWALRRCSTSTRWRSAARFIRGRSRSKRSRGDKASTRVACSFTWAFPSVVTRFVRFR